jgi:hypothetical protein
MCWKKEGRKGARTRKSRGIQMEIEERKKK